MFETTNQSSRLWWNVSLATRAIGVLCLLPVLEKFHSLPALLTRLTPSRPDRKVPGDDEMDRVVLLVRRLCHRRPFRSALFPKACLRQSLVLYHVLTHKGYPVEFHLGARKQGEELICHSWLTLFEKPVGEREIPKVIRTLYCYPTPANSEHFL